MRGGAATLSIALVSLVYSGAQHYYQTPAAQIVII